MTIYPVPKPPKKVKMRKPLRSKTRLKTRGQRTQKSGGHLFPKSVDEARREYVRGFPCLACVTSFAEQRSPTLACHVKSRGSSGIDAGNLYPACDQHHTEQHVGGIQSFQRRYQINLANVAANIEASYCYQARGGVTPAYPTPHKEIL